MQYLLRLVLRLLLLTPAPTPIPDEHQQDEHCRCTPLEQWQCSFLRTACRFACTGTGAQARRERQLHTHSASSSAQPCGCGDGVVFVFGVVFRGPGMSRDESLLSHKVEVWLPVLKEHDSTWSSSMTCQHRQVGKLRFCFREAGSLYGTALYSRSCHGRGRSFDFFGTRASAAVFASRSR